MEDMFLVTIRRISVGEYCNEGTANLHLPARESTYLLLTWVTETFSDFPAHVELFQPINIPTDSPKGTAD